MAAFYDRETAILAAAITRAQAHQAGGHAGQQAKADAIAGQIAAKQAAVDRYHAAFENGTMDDATAGPRLKALQEEITQLRARHDQITDALATRPAPPPVTTLEHLRGYLAQFLTVTGTTTERKAAIEALIHEIKITEEGLIPVYRIPAPGSPVPGHDDTSQAPVRTIVQSVGLTCQHPNPGWLAEGPEIMIRRVRDHRV